MNTLIQTQSRTGIPSSWRREILIRGGLFGKDFLITLALGGFVLVLAILLIIVTWVRPEYHVSRETFFSTYAGMALCTAYLGGIMAMAQEKESGMIPVVSSMPISISRVLGQKLAGVLLALALWLLLWDLVISIMVQIFFPAVQMHPLGLFFMLNSSGFRLGAIGAGMAGSLLQFLAAALTGMAVVLIARTLVASAFLGCAVLGGLMWLFSTLFHGAQGNDGRADLNVVLLNSAISAIMATAIFPLWKRFGDRDSHIGDASLPAGEKNATASLISYLGSMAARKWMTCAEVGLAAWVLVANAEDQWAYYVATIFVALLMFDAAEWISPQEWSNDFSIHALPLTREKFFVSRIWKRILSPVALAMAPSCSYLAILYQRINGDYHWIWSIAVVRLLSFGVLGFYVASVFVKDLKIRLVLAGAVLLFLNLPFSPMQDISRIDQVQSDAHALLVFAILIASVCGTFAVIAIRLFFRNPLLVILMAMVPTIAWSVAIIALAFNVFIVRLGSPAWVQYTWTLLAMGAPCLAVAYIGFCRSRLLEQSENHRGMLGVLVTLALTIWVGFFITADPFQFAYLVFRH